MEKMGNNSVFGYKVRGRFGFRGSAGTKNQGEMESAGRAPHTKGLGKAPASPPKPGRGRGSSSSLWDGRLIFCIMRC